MCYIMTQIARCKQVDNHLAQNIVNSFMAKLAIKFLHDKPHTWTKEDFEAKILANPGFYFFLLFFLVHVYKCKMLGVALKGDWQSS